MFTGIITDVGEILTVKEMPEGLRTRISTKCDLGDLEIGASIACGGPCHTVVSKGADQSVHWFEVESSIETLKVTTVGLWKPGMKLNLERSLRIGDELGGHLVTGHVDATSEILMKESEGSSVRLKFKVYGNLMRFIAKKGSVALDGTSLTVNEVENDTFTVQLIPHTLSVTTWQERRIGDLVNLEVDLMARYAARLTESS